MTRTQTTNFGKLCSYPYRVWFFSFRFFFVDNIVSYNAHHANGLLMHTPTSLCCILKPIPKLPCQALARYKSSLPSVSYLAEKSPDDHTLSHIQQLESDSADASSIDSDNLNETLPPRKSHPPVLISNGFPPIPFRLVKRVEDGLFVKMAELLPSYLDSADLNSDDQHARSRRQPPTVSDIVDWIRVLLYTRQLSPARSPDGLLIF